jgi:hypothetical protein
MLNDEKWIFVFRKIALRHLKVKAEAPDNYFIKYPSLFLLQRGKAKVMVLELFFN